MPLKSWVAQKVEREVGNSRDELHAERARLVQLKLDYEEQVRKFGEMIFSAQRNFHKTGIRSPNYERWLIERTQYLTGVRNIERRLGECKIKLQQEALKQQAENRERREQRHHQGTGNIEQIFMGLAKEMLAGPVYDRIMIAAIHRRQEQFEQEQASEQANERE